MGMGGFWSSHPFAPSLFRGVHGKLILVEFIRDVAKIYGQRCLDS